LIKYNPGGGTAPDIKASAPFGYDPPPPAYSVDEEKNVSKDIATIKKDNFFIVCLRGYFNTA